MRMYRDMNGELIEILEAMLENERLQRPNTIEMARELNNETIKEQTRQILIGKLENLEEGARKAELEETYDNWPVNLGIFANDIAELRFQLTQRTYWFPERARVNNITRALKMADAREEDLSKGLDHKKDSTVNVRGAANHVVVSFK